MPALPPSAPRDPDEQIVKGEGLPRPSKMQRGAPGDATSVIGSKGVFIRSKGAAVPTRDRSLGFLEGLATATSR
jgi:hypothetical protein